MRRVACQATDVGISISQRSASVSQAISLMTGDCIFLRANSKVIALTMECDNSAGALATYGALVSALQASLQGGLSRLEEDRISIG